MDRAKAAAVAELKAGKGISPATQSSLMSAADDLGSKFEDAKPHLLEESTGDRIRIQQYIDAKHFIQEARSGVYRLVAARQLADVMPAESFTGRTVDQLLTYISRQGLRFAPAATSGDGAYNTVFRLMTEYYTSLHGLALAIEQNDRKLAKLDAEAGRLMDARNRDTLAALKEVLEAGPNCGPMVKFGDVAECAAAAKETLFPTGRPAVAAPPRAKAQPVVAAAPPRPAAKPLVAAAPPPVARMPVVATPAFQRGAAACENYLGERQWRGQVTRVEGEDYWVRMEYSHKRDYRVGKEYAFRGNILMPCPMSSTIEIPQLYWLGYQPPVMSLPRPVPQPWIPRPSPHR